MNPNPVSLPEDYGFTHSIRGEDPGAVAKQYTAAQTLTGLTQVVRSVYFNGRSAQLQTMGQEFEFQLDGQYSVLAQIPADKYVQAREVFKHQGRQGAAATQRARTDLENRLTRYRKKLEDKPSRAEARRWAREVMKQVAILHNPDQILGGEPSPALDRGGAPIPGDRAVNSSLGAQNRSNAALIDAAAHKQIASGYGHLPMRFQVVLTNRRQNVERLRAKQPPPPLKHPTQPTHNTPPQPPTLTTAAKIRHTLSIQTPKPPPTHTTHKHTHPTHTTHHKKPKL